LYWYVALEQQAARLTVLGYGRRLWLPAIGRGSAWLLNFGEFHHDILRAMPQDDGRVPRGIPALRRS
jgi:hypothetical protein